MQKIIYTIFIASSIITLWAQPVGRIREFGLNTTTLLTQLVPFNRGSNLSSPYNVHFVALGKMGRGIRASLGAEISERIGDNFFLNILVGYERRKWVGNDNKFVYRRGIHAFANVGGTNSNSDFIDESATLGIAIARGLEYQPIDALSISIEALLHFGIGSASGLVIDISPPLALNLNVKF